MRKLELSRSFKTNQLNRRYHMRLSFVLLLIVTFLGLSGCQKENKETRSSINEPAVSTAPARTEGQASLASNDSLKQQASSQVSLSQADAASLASQAIERKIIRNANLTIEVTSPPDSQRRISTIAESHQG